MNPEHFFCAFLLIKDKFENQRRNLIFLSKEPHGNQCKNKKSYLHCGGVVFRRQGPKHA